jgi:hypothetical protein
VRDAVSPSTSAGSVGLTEHHGLFGLPALLPAVLFVVSAAIAIDVPGVYMDAVNPDYMVVRLLNPAAREMAVWIMPGQLILGKLPVLAQLYQGALPFYFGLPAYLLFGTGLLGIRIAEIGFGLIVLSGAWLFLWAFAIRPWMAAVGLCALALDPAFVMSFRTQAYIAILPLGLLLSSIAIAALGTAEGRRASTVTLLSSGALAGLAFFGYFFYLFPVLTIPVYLACVARSGVGTGRLLALWSAGFAIGLSPYVLGYLRLLSAFGDVSGFLAYLRETLGGLQVARSSLTLAGRARYFLDMADLVFFNRGNGAMLLHAPGRSVGDLLRVALLLAVPTVVLAASVLARRAVPGLACCAALALGFFILTLIFGDRLWAHHFVAMVPIIYLGFIIALDRIADRLSAPISRRGIVAVVLVPLTLVNGVNHRAFVADLRATGGVGLASDAIVRFAEQSKQDEPQTYFFFPDWGVFMPFAMITAGRFGYETDFDPTAARRILCSGRDAVLALVHRDGDVRLAGWAATVDWGEPAIEAFRQRDGTIVLDVARWRADVRPATAATCG